MWLIAPSQPMMQMEIHLGLQLQMAQIGLPCQVRQSPIVTTLRFQDNFAIAARLWLNQDENLLDDDEWQHALRLDILVR